MASFDDETIDGVRRRLLGASALMIPAAQVGIARSAHAQAPPSLPAVRPGTNTSFGTLKQVDAGLLNVGYAEAGPATGRRCSCCTAGPTTSTASWTWLRCWRPPATA